MGYGLENRLHLPAVTAPVIFCKKTALYRQSEEGKMTVHATSPPPRHPQGEAIQHTRIDCFTLRDDVHDHLNCPYSVPEMTVQNSSELFKRRLSSIISLWMYRLLSLFIWTWKENFRQNL
jgi:hypothetical protein